MQELETNHTEKFLYLNFEKTLYEISVKQSENATKSVEDILLHLIVGDPRSEFGEGNHG